MSMRQEFIDGHKENMRLSRILAHLCNNELRGGT